MSLFPQEARHKEATLDCVATLALERDSVTLGFKDMSLKDDNLHHPSLNKHQAGQGSVVSSPALTPP